jgi:hypothetical protein
MFSKKGLALMGVSVVGATGAGIHYCVKKNPELLSTYSDCAGLPENCYFLRMVENINSWRNTSVQKPEDDKKK